jgi:transposase-like protein
VVNVATVIATAVNADRHRGILGRFTAEEGTAWTTSLRGLVARSLHGIPSSPTPIRA